MVKRAVVLLLSSALVLGTAACSSGNTGNDKGKAEATKQPAAATDKGSSTAVGNHDKKYTITSMDFLFSGIPPKDGPGVKMINERFNVDFQKDTTVYSEYEAKLATVISSGNIPDVMGFVNLDTNYFKWAEQGAFLPLDEFIKDFPTLKMVPDDVYAPAKLNGKTYAIPRYFPADYLNGIIIRQDWLDNLGLKMPTNYEELKKVALAFTNDDPDKNGKKDTYGMVMGQNINPNYSMGPAWEPAAWYFKDKNGNFIPSFISDTRKEMTTILRDLYAAGAITHDFAMMNPTQFNKEFYSGKGGIYSGSPRGMNETYMKSLIEIAPNAKLKAIPPFKQADGSQGFTAGSGYYTAIALSAKLKDQPDKVRRILEMIDLGRKFIPLSERNGKNADFDWVNGKEGTGYKVENGLVVQESSEKGLSPFNYLPDNKMWAPKDEMNEYSKTYAVPQLRDLVIDLEKVHSSTKHYINPIYQANSPLYATKATELYNKLIDVQSKMIAGVTPMSDWDKMVEEFMKTGGEAMIKEVNEGIKKSGYKSSWK